MSGIIIIFQHIPRSKYKNIVGAIEIYGLESYYTAITSDNKFVAFERGTENDSEDKMVWNVLKY